MASGIEYFVCTSTKRLYKRRVPHSMDAVPPLVEALSKNNEWSVLSPLDKIMFEVGLKLREIKPISQEQLKLFHIYT